MTSTTTKPQGAARGKKPRQPFLGAILFRRVDEAYFRARYDADARNVAKQSWSEYQKWVTAFYEGKRFPPVTGWDARRAAILRDVPSASRDEIAPLLDEVGRTLAAEWAKDNGVRRVSTADLQTWGKRFTDATRDPAALMAALRDVQAEVAKRLSG